VKGSPAGRRKFLDTEVSQVSSLYRHLLHKYKRIVKQRNNLLKEIRHKQANTDENMLAVWNEQLVETGSKIIKKRLEVTDKLKILARLAQRRITGGDENLSIEYKQSFSREFHSEKEIKVIFEENLVNNKDREIERGYTLFGPHRDDLILKINDIDIRKFGSQGQQRTVALALKLAELEFMKSEVGEYPVLLLDDVFSELDSFRRSTLMEVIADNIQTFITTTGKQMDGLKDKSERGSFFSVEGGKISRKVK
ncbi:MAG: DNA replication/repair protein RecF, partial [Halanaerobiales bacterium]